MSIPITKTDCRKAKLIDKENGFALYMWYKANELDYGEYPLCFEVQRIGEKDGEECLFLNDSRFFESEDDAYEYIENTPTLN